MIRLLYFSRAAKGIEKAQVQEIMLTAQKNNTADGVTGVLVHGGGLFLQVLEGPEPVVLRRYVKIIDDPRHTDCRILLISPAHDRIFKKWSMGGIAGDPLQFEHVVELRAHRLESVNSSAFTSTMREFAAMLHAKAKANADAHADPE